ncbi:MAG: translation initiation factor 1 (eIF-1/SUI1) [Planctomycetota bacterium]|jgi:translation initiation factor 1 (eIF-1/SUI1)
MGENVPMAKKREQIDLDLSGGNLTHNPFAALGGGKKLPEPAKTVARKAVQKGAPASASKLPASSSKLVVRFEAKGHGGKVVTRISGLDKSPDELEVLAKLLRKAMGAGARAIDGDVLVQGKLVERVTKWLQSKGYGHAVRGN